MIGVYWGAFDPPTVAHLAIICAALNEIPLKKIIVVVNNHEYKKYTIPLKDRLNLVKKMSKASGIKNYELCVQDEKQKIDYLELRTFIKEPLCAVAGYDAYLEWMNHSTLSERKQYDAIAVIPRGSKDPVLFDSNAFLLRIKEEYKHVSSTGVRGGFL